MSNDGLSSFLSYLLSGLSYCFSIPFFYIVVFKSPPFIRVYRNTILNLGIWYCVTMASYSILFQPAYTKFSTKSCARFMGLVSYFGVNVNIIVIFLAVICVENTVVAKFICFLYRYAQMRRANRANFLKSWKGLLICVAMHITVSILSGCLSYVFLINGEIIEENGTFLLCADEHNYNIVKRLTLIVLIVFISQSAAIAAFAFMTIRCLSSLKTHMTKRTYKLNQLLTINLVVLLIFPIVFHDVPICILCCMIYIKSDSMYFWVSFTGHAPFGELILTFSTILWFVTPYREAVKAMLWKKSVVVPNSNVT
ncbi:hypothetical protein QR680_015346 [Steinernema hermaphroditum]|uniref:Uncharacterized protein n=1 Tax=Steinernema hermaphroditum TaxID=289476 RepID=A0AA39H7D7_9BILA|nr:hypothetical protein QR680_015346 [Steinernema hermaphroditum]